MIVWLVVACEIGFWIVVVAGLVARYLFRARRTGLALLASAPILDVVLLVATGIDLRNGATADWRHGLAAIYLGFSVAYGHRLVAWADAQWAHRFAGAPARPRLVGRAYTRHCWADAGRTLLAAGVACAVVGLLAWWVGSPARTAPLAATVLPVMGLVLCVDVLWAVSYTVAPRRRRGVGSTMEVAGTRRR